MTNEYPFSRTPAMDREALRGAKHDLGLIISDIGGRFFGLDKSPLRPSEAESSKITFDDYKRILEAVSMVIAKEVALADSEIKKSVGMKKLQILAEAENSLSERIPPNKDYRIHKEAIGVIITSLNSRDYLPGNEQGGRLLETIEAGFDRELFVKNPFESTVTPTDTNPKREKRSLFSKLLRR